MANFKYFADTAAGTVELQSVRHNGGSVSKAKSFSGRGDNGELMTATRMIEFKPSPSRHVCDDRCMNATGKVMKCECSCGGKNHGRGSSVLCAA